MSSKQDNGQQPQPKPIRHENGRWAVGTPSPNLRGRPTEENPQEFTILPKALHPLAAAFLKFDRGDSGAFDQDGNPMSRGERALEALYIRSLTNNKAAEICHDARAAAYAEETNVRQDILRKAKRYIDKHTPAFELTERMNRPLPNIFPDQRNIKIRNDSSVIVEGPLSQEESARYQHILRRRDEILKAISMFVIERDDQREYVMEARSILQKELYKCHLYIPKEKRRRISPLVDLTELDDER